MDERIELKKKLCCLCVFLCCMTSCKHVEPIVQIEYRDSVRLEYKHDSIYLYEKDSIYIDRWRSGDTVYLTTEKWLTRYKDKIIEVHDTLIIDKSKTETVQVKYVPKFYKTCTWGFWIIIVCVVLFIVWKVAKRFYFRE